MLITNGIAVSVGMVSAVGFANLINMMVSKLLWIWFAIGFVIAIFTQINLFVLAACGLVVAIGFVWLKNKRHGASGDSGSDDDMDSFDKELDDL